MHRNKLSYIIAVLAVLVASANATAAPKTDLWPRWQVFDAGSTTAVDHSAWDRMLDRYLEADHPAGINRMRYARVSSADKAGLAAYLETLQKTAVSRLNRNEQAAYWINLYNAGTVGSENLSHRRTGSIPQRCGAPYPPSASATITIGV